MKQIGDRMKENYENSYRIFLPKRLPVIIRVDGRAFHTFTKGCERPFDKKLIDAMSYTAHYMVQNIHNAEFAYVQSDEISILLNDYKKFTTESWFGKNLQKMVSISASMATASFNYYYDSEKMAMFDSRVLVLPKEEVCNYFIWRQMDWRRNSIQMLAQSLYSHKDLQFKGTSDLMDMCMEKDHNWNDLETYLKRGIACTKEKDGLDKEIPIFTKDRKYIEKHLEAEE